MTESACPCETSHPPDPRWVGWIAWVLVIGFFTLLTVSSAWPHSRFFRPAYLTYFVAFAYGLPIVNRGRGCDYLSIRARLVFSVFFGTLIVGICAYAILTEAK